MIRSDENFFCLRTGGLLLIYSFELEAAVASLDTTNGIIFFFSKLKNITIIHIHY